VENSIYLKLQIKVQQMNTCSNAVSAMACEHIPESDISLCQCIQENNRSTLNYSSVHSSTVFLNMVL